MLIEVEVQMMEVQVVEVEVQGMEVVLEVLSLFLLMEVVVLEML